MGVQINLLGGFSVTVDGQSIPDRPGAGATRRRWSSCSRSARVAASPASS